MNNKKKVIGIIIFIVILIIVILLVGLIIIKIQKDKEENKGLVADEYGDYPDYEPDENQIDNNTQTEDVEENTDELQENYFDKLNISDQQMAENYFIDYRDNRLYFPDEAYKTLEESYRNRRFETIEQYKEYLNTNRSNIAEATMQKYNVSEENGKKIYTCMDQNSNYYIFIEDTVMQYTVREGKYNPEPEGFEEQYENSIDETKAMRNINRFIAMINNKEYDSAYKVLEANFKEANFSTEEEFANYINDNFFEENNIEYNSANEQDGKYICETNIINQLDEDDDKKQKVFEVTLLEGTDFTISFNME